MTLAAAEYILAHPHEYTAPVLGQSPQDYAAWIIKNQSWGGAIELAVFSAIYSVEIASFDVQTERMDLFGEGHAQRVYLQYTGIHYEAFAQTPFDGAPCDFDVTVFARSDDAVLAQVRELVHIAQQAHRFTDLAAFQLRCETCRQGLRGEREAQAHAKTTGHSSFIEFE